MVVQWNINVQVVSDFMDGMSPPAHRMTQAFNMLAARSSGDSGGVSGRASSARGRGKTYQNVGSVTEWVMPRALGDQ